jgi:Ca-activated chloride channel homolog
VKDWPDSALGIIRFLRRLERKANPRDARLDLGDRNAGIAWLDEAGQIRWSSESVRLRKRFAKFSADRRAAGSGWKPERIRPGWLASELWVTSNWSKVRAPFSPFFVQRPLNVLGIDMLFATIVPTGSNLHTSMKFGLISLLLLAQVVLSSAMWAQSPQNADSNGLGSQTSTNPNESLLTLHAAVSEVHLVFTVTDKHGHYVRDLKQEDFELLDDRKPPEKILSFRNETELPLQVGLLIDVSQSVRERFAFEQEAAIAFLNQSLRGKHDQAFVMGFDMTPKVTQDFTDDIGRLADGIHLLQPGTLTAMYDAAYYSCNKLLKQSQNMPVRRVLILLSDGYDNASSVTRERVIETAQRAEVSVYTIRTSLTAGGGGQKTLEAIAEKTGGRSYVPAQITGVANAFTAIQTELRSQYAVSYKPTAFKLDGRYRTIEIRTPNKKGLRIRSRTGYRTAKIGYASDR